MKLNSIMRTICHTTAAACVGLCLLAPGPVSAADLVLFDENYQIPTQITIGTDLWMGVTAATPFTTYKVELVSDLDVLITSMSVQTNNLGQSAVQKFWHETGVIGCDPCIEADARYSLYETYADAEADLDQRTFTVRLIDKNNNIVDSESFTLVTDPNLARIYVADSQDCPSPQRASGDDLNLVLENLPSTVSEVRVFVIAEPTISGLIGSSLQDLRNSAPNGTVIIPDGNPIQSQLLWDDPDDVCDFQLVIRYAHNGQTTSTNPLLELGDLNVDGSSLIGEPGNHGGRWPEDDNCEVC